ncbi:MAG: AAA family ATPase [Bacteroidales bacterium]|jgi:predicted AAA+ superfamily ATPase|nr:AAA family ATPase [Bacteroidales bacterium]
MIKRETYLSKLRELKDIQIIKVVAGVRRCGKSTLLELYRDELLQLGVAAENIQFYNLEVIVVRYFLHFVTCGKFHSNLTY